MLLTIAVWVNATLRRVAVHLPRGERAQAEWLAVDSPRPERGGAARGGCLRGQCERDGGDRRGRRGKVRAADGAATVSKRNPERAGSASAMAMGMKSVRAGLNLQEAPRLAGLRMDMAVNAPVVKNAA